jgi:hypothetical protein
VEASPVHLEEQLGGAGLGPCGKNSRPSGTRHPTKAHVGLAVSRPRKPAGITHQRLFLSHCGALKAKPRQSTQRGGASNASNSDIGSPAERPSHIDERRAVTMARPCHGAFDGEGAIR